MAKQTALDAKLAEIDQQIAQMEADLDKWKGMRDFLKKGNVAEAEPKPKRGRKPKARGLPVQAATEQV